MPWWGWLIVAAALGLAAWSSRKWLKSLGGVEEPFASARGFDASAFFSPLPKVGFAEPLESN